MNNYKLDLVEEEEEGLSFVGDLRGVVTLCREKLKKLKEHVEKSTGDRESIEAISEMLRELNRILSNAEYTFEEEEF